MSMLDAFDDEMNKTYSIFPKETGLDADNEVIEGFADTATLTAIQCAFYTGSVAEKLMADRYKTEAAGVVISEVQDVPDSSKLTLNDGREFIALHADDVMEQGEVLVITVRSPDYGQSI